MLAIGRRHGNYTIFAVLPTSTPDVYVVAAANPEMADPYVVWEANPDGTSFWWGHYKRDLTSALADLVERSDVLQLAGR
jgi:hypothetical protein